MKNQLELDKINISLNSIKENINYSTTKIEGILGETLIAAIQKEEKKIENNSIKKRAKELRKLIKRLEKNKKTFKSKEFLSLGKFKDIYPVEKLSIEKIRTDKSKTGILLTLKSDSILKAPKNGLVVYADFFKGYGNMVIMDLGDDYHLILSGLSNIFCKTGDWLEKNAVIGDAGISIKSDIYIEVRFKGKTISPKNWFNS